MSGRPSDPSYAVITWDTGNYPAGGNPWNGTAKRVNPGGTFISPNDGAGAQVGNYLWGAGFDLDASHKAAITGVLDLVGQNPALNWLPKTTSSGTRNMNRAAFSAKDQTWFTVGLSGGTDHGAKSDDYGRTWTDLTLGSTLSLLDVACDASGNVSIIAQGSRSVYFGSRTAFGTVTFAATANALTVAPSGGSLSRDETHGVFIACYRNAALGMKVDTSTNGTAWTARTIPAVWTSYTGTAQSPHITSNAAGTTVAVFWDDVAGLLRFARSTDGGTTWTAVQNSSTGMSASASSDPVVRPTHDSVSGIWYTAISTGFGGTRQAQIWKSIDDGVTWTSATLFVLANDVIIHGLVALGALLVLTDDRGRIAWSINAGASWLWAHRNPQATAGTDTVPLGLRGGQGGLLLLNAPDRVAYASMRFGNDGQAV